MPKTLCTSTLLFVMLLISSACSMIDLSQKEATFSKLIRVEEMNTKIKFWKLRSTETFQIGDSVDLTLENFSQDKIIFPGDYGARIFRYDNNNGAWIEIENGANYFPIGNTQISPKSADLPGVIGVGLWPILQNEGRPIEIRVVVIGNVEKDNVLTDEQVGAYIDINLKP